MENFVGSIENGIKIPLDTMKNRVCSSIEPLMASFMEYLAKYMLIKMIEICTSGNAEGSIVSQTPQFLSLKSILHISLWEVHKGP